MPRLGAHISIAEGIDEALIIGKRAGCETIQIFTRNSNQWRAKEISQDTVRLFRENQKKTGIYPVFVHDSYLINLASPASDILEKSRKTFLLELERTEKLGVPYLVMHPGSHLGSGEKQGIKSISESLNLVLKKTRGFKTKVLIETTAGQGTSLGFRFEHLRDIIKLVKDRSRVGVCLDSAHIFAAGYDLRTKSSYNKTMSELDKIIGIDKVKLFHLNDSKKPLGSRVDRHEHIGKGFMGLASFGFILNDKRFKDLPMIIETPKKGDFSKADSQDKKNLKILRSLIK